MWRTVGGVNARKEEILQSTFDMVNVESYDDAVPEIPRPPEVLTAMNIVIKLYESRWDTQLENFQSLNRMREYRVNQILNELRITSDQRAE